MKDLFARIAELRRNGCPFALATIIYSEDSTPRKTGSRMVIHHDGKVEGSIGGGALEKRVVSDAQRLLQEGSSDRFIYDLGKDEKDISVGMICGGKVEVLIESFQTMMKIIVFGAGHVGHKLAEICKVLNISCWIIDNRDEYAKDELFPGAAGVLCSDFTKSFSQLPIDENSYLIIVTYGHKHDGICLESALKTRARYIGMIGSKTKVRSILESLSKKGANTEDPRIFSPIGLHLGDNTPEEISISIISEILKLKSDGTGRHCRDLV